MADATQVLQGLHKIPAESLTHKNIENGVQATVEKGNGLSDLEEDVNVGGNGTVGDEHGVGVDGLDQQNAVVGELR